MADLFRSKGVGEEYADLLEAAAVGTVPELGQRNPENLYKELKEVDEAKKLVPSILNLKEVTVWAEQAKTLPRKAIYRYDKFNLGIKQI